MADKKNKKDGKMVCLVSFPIFVIYTRSHLKSQVSHWFRKVLYILFKC